MRAAHIGNEKTYRAALRDLEAWWLLAYLPGRTRYQPSTCSYRTCPSRQVSEPKVPLLPRPHQGQACPRYPAPEAKLPTLLPTHQGQERPNYVGQKCLSCHLHWAQNCPNTPYMVKQALVNLTLQNLLPTVVVGSHITQKK